MKREIKTLKKEIASGKALEARIRQLENVNSTPKNTGSVPSEEGN